MATYATIMPEGSANGAPVLVTATTTGAAQTLHTAHATLHDEIEVLAANLHTADRDLTIEIGGATTPIVVTIPPKAGYVTVLSRARLTGSATVKVFASSASVIRVQLNVNQITNA